MRRRVRYVCQKCGRSYNRYNYKQIVRCKMCPFCGGDVKKTQIRGRER